MKIFWISNAPWVGSGYGNQTAIFMPRLKDKLGHELVCLAFYGHEGMPMNYQGITVYGNGFGGYGVDQISPIAQLSQADISITLIDAWVYNQSQMFPNTRWVPWFPVDMEPLPPPVERAVRPAHKRIVFSRFGERMVNNAEMDCYYVPHGIETELFRPYEQRQARLSLGFPDDRYIVGMVAANKGVPSRKAFTPQIEAFARFKRKHPDAALYLHTIAHAPAIGGQSSTQGVNLPEYCNYLGLTHSEAGAPGWEKADVWFSAQFQTKIGFAPQFMVQMYSSLDVFMLVSMGEGFGIPIMEAQACGCPVIVGGWTAMDELCLSGWKVPKVEADPWWTPLGANQWMPRVGAIHDLLEASYRKSGDMKLREKARQGALAYDADLVTTQYWKPVLEDIQTGIEDNAVKLVRF